MESFFQRLQGFPARKFRSETNNSIMSIVSWGVTIIRKTCLASGSVIKSFFTKNNKSFTFHLRKMDIRFSNSTALMISIITFSCLLITKLVYYATKLDCYTGIITLRLLPVSAEVFFRRPRNSKLVALLLCRPRSLSPA